MKSPSSSLLLELAGILIRLILLIAGLYLLSLILGASASIMFGWSLERGLRAVNYAVTAALVFTFVVGTLIALFASTETEKKWVLAFSIISTVILIAVMLITGFSG